MYYIALLLLFMPLTHSLNFVIPLPNTLVMAGTSSLVTWGGLGENITATNLYLGNGATTDQLTIISIFGQGMPSSKTSMWITMPKNAPNDNTYLVLEGNDTPPTRATVPLNIALGSKDTPSAVPTATASSSASSSTSSSFSSSASSTSSSATKTKPPSTSDSLLSTTSSSVVPTPSNTSLANSASLTTGQTIGIIIGSIGVAGLALGALFFIRRHRRLNNQKRHTELFDEKDTSTLDYNQPYASFPSQPPMGYPEPISYSRNANLAPSSYYPMKTLESTNMRDNGFQARTQIDPSSPPLMFATANKPDEVTVADRPDKPHSRT